MILSLIAAMGRNRVIGKNNALPWNMPADMQRFRALTRNKPVIMGMNTFISIGRALPNRLNIVLTRDHKWGPPGGAIAVYSLQEAMEKAGGHHEIMVIGGEQIFKVFMPLADKMYLTFIDHDFEGDTFFPAYDLGEWREVERTQWDADAENSYPYAFVALERILK